MSHLFHYNTSKQINMRNFILIIFYLLITQVHAQSEFTYGVISKLEFNKFKTNFQSESIVKNEIQTTPMPAIGAYISQSLGNKLFMDFSLLISRAKYDVGYKIANVEMVKADIRFTQFNANLNYIVNPKAYKTKLYAFGGVQNLYRRWGEENYINEVIANSYWPTNRLQTQLGLGAKIYSNSSIIFQPFVGLRMNNKNQLIYDTQNNQIFMGIVIGIKAIKNKKRNYNKCPRAF